MIEVTSVQLVDGVDVLAYVFRSDGLQWVCLRSQGTPLGRGWIECWSNKDGVVPDLGAALEAIRAIMISSLKRGPLGAYLDGAHFIPGWNTWGGAMPKPIARFRPHEIVAGSSGPVALTEYLS